MLLGSVVSSNFENFGHHFCKYFSVPLFFYSRTLIICMLDILVLFCKSFMLCVIIFSYFSLCASFNYFLILCLQVHYLFFWRDQSANSTQCIFLFQKLYFTFLWVLCDSFFNFPFFLLILFICFFAFISMWAYL